MTGDVMRVKWLKEWLWQEIEELSFVVQIWVEYESSYNMTGIDNKGNSFGSRSKWLHADEKIRYYFIVSDFK